MLSVTGRLVAPLGWRIPTAQLPDFGYMWMWKDTLLFNIRGEQSYIVVDKLLSYRRLLSAFKAPPQHVPCLVRIGGKGSTQ